MKRLVRSPALPALLAVVLLGASAAVLVTADPATARGVATLDPVTGTVEVRRAGSPGFREVDEETPVRAGDAIRTGTDGRAEVRFPGGNLARLDLSTTLLIQELAADPGPGGVEVVSLNQPLGRTYHRVPELEHDESRYQILTPASLVSVRGTEFAVSVEGDGSSTSWVLGGELSVLTLRGPVPVDEDEGFVVFPGGVGGQPFTLSGEHLADPWLANTRCETDEDEGVECPPVEGEIGVLPSVTPPGFVPPSTIPSVVPPTPPVTSPSPGRPSPGAPPQTTLPPTSPVPPTTPPAGGGGGGGGGTPPPEPGPSRVPQTSITGAPNLATRSLDASFSFVSDRDRVSFACRLDGGAWAGCRSPRYYQNLGEGTHLFKVRASTRRHGTDPTPAAYTWTIDRSAPESVIDDGPPSPTSNANVTFHFHATEAQASFECSLDGGSFTPCSSPKSYEVHAAGTHTFRVRATDRAGNKEPIPASDSWEKT